jgi:hypothetical protein
MAPATLALLSPDKQGTPCQVFNYKDGTCYTGTMAEVDGSRLDNTTQLLWRKKGLWSFKIDTVRSAYFVMCYSIYFVSVSINFFVLQQACFLIDTIFVKTFFPEIFLSTNVILSNIKLK